MLMIEVGQPHENSDNQLLFLSDIDVFTTFSLQTPQKYTFTIEEEFIQLRVIGNIVAFSRANRSGLSSIIPHCDGYTRLKFDTMVKESGAEQVLKVTDHVTLEIKLLQHEDRRFEVEILRIRVRTAEMLVTMEKMIHSGSHTTALVLRRP